jgi:hypothetical protein
MMSAVRTVGSDCRVAVATPRQSYTPTTAPPGQDSAPARKACGDALRATDAMTLLTAELKALSETLCALPMQKPSLDSGSAFDAKDS